MKALLFLNFLLEFLGNVQGKNATEIPISNTPSPGPWPQSNVKGCGNTGLPDTSILSECDEPLNPDAPDIRGYWRVKAEDGSRMGEIGEYIGQCGSRWIDISKPVVHDFPECTGEVGDSLGLQDYNGPFITKKNGLCKPIVVACKFEIDADDNKCINLYTKHQTTQVVTKVVTRCLQSDGSMIWTHPIVGTTVYEKVPKEDEPNCMMCVGGRHNGATACDYETKLPCSYEQRRWTRCENEECEYSSGARPASSILGVATFLLAIHFM